MKKRVGVILLFILISVITGCNKSRISENSFAENAKNCIRIRNRNE